jgi:hypothetical protein
MNTLKGKLTNNRIRWYEYILRINEDRIPKKVSDMKMKGKYPRGNQPLMEPRHWSLFIMCHFNINKRLARTSGYQTKIN